MNKDNWQYRIVHHAVEGVEFYDIRVVYYDDDGNPIKCSEQPVSPISETIEKLSHQMIHMMSAFTLPVIERGVFEYNTADGVADALDMLRSRK